MVKAQLSPKQCAIAPKALASQGFGRALAIAMAKRALAIHCLGIALQRTWHTPGGVHSMDPPFPSLTTPQKPDLPKCTISQAKVGSESPKCTPAYAQDTRRSCRQLILGGFGGVGFSRVFALGGPKGVPESV